MTSGTELTDLNIEATVIDADSGALRFSIMDSNLNTFSIFEVTGAITVEQPLDYETTQLYVFSIVVTDGQDNQDTAEVTISVSDVNDNPPIFDQSVYAITVPELQFLGNMSRVGILNASDADSGINGQVTFSIVNGNEDSAFTLDSEAGTISLSGQLDRETTASYNLTVQALDGGEPQLNANATVLIAVSDVNDNAPTFDQFSYTVTVPSDSSIGSTVFTAAAKDNDIGSNSAITYSIEGGNENEIFSIDKKSGAIFIVQSLQDETVTKLAVVAVDGGFPSLSGTTIVTVVVDNTNSDIQQTTIIADMSLTTSSSFKSAHLSFLPLLLSIGLAYHLKD